MWMRRSREQAAPVRESCRCCGSLTRRRGTSIRAGASVQVPLRSTPSRTMPKFWRCWTYVRTTAMRTGARGISFMLFGFPICLCSAWKATGSGVCFAHLMRQVCRMRGATSTQSCMSATKERVELSRLLKRASCGLPLLRARLRLAHRICCIRMRVTVSLTTSTLALLRAAIFARK